ncbi:hypothetical protein PVAP13_2NG562500 [Panicum virgatum]|uniref:Uncharacterized protein n=1 Tax=Panicum virgatum TaxID=38727 RepID=A0A8T0W0A0_PANVG|nr:hypothetical protein PVAP13_2NG562500 [Panicum virgatum]
MARVRHPSAWSRLQVIAPPQRSPARRRQLPGSPTVAPPCPAPRALLAACSAGPRASLLGAAALPRLADRELRRPPCLPARRSRAPPPASSVSCWPSLQVLLPSAP